ncbi:hypothetical protein BH23PSE1_BH23PSE1_12950 [soil metagenome]
MHNITPPSLVPPLRAHALAHPGEDRPRHDARALTDGGREARITLDDRAYTLRITRQGKLILTK